MRKDVPHLCLVAVVDLALWSILSFAMKVKMFFFLNCMEWKLRYTHTVVIFDFLNFLLSPVTDFMISRYQHKNGASWSWFLSDYDCEFLWQRKGKRLFLMTGHVSSSLTIISSHLFWSGNQISLPGLMQVILLKNPFQRDWLLLI